ncbi:hypothetical protein [Desulfitobacterium hafniense]|uniref:Uncharacterized protein n=3 Tax=root TaxID=1 RepID=Q24UH9_DESHY|nr:hypothetical protein [Desulfitobacterium hafniense]KTE90745.1 hypothetical protein AT727_23770 [Desulfitobacterium hafniense]MEA5024730.1 hypothetical protein [Desulfitobacterium hafniense]BAE84313.1 hypothetical protein DSY2524 [Desulfitobacterium hafniense Y51]
MLYGIGLLLFIYLGVHYYEQLWLTASRSFDPTSPLLATVFEIEVLSEALADGKISIEPKERLQKLAEDKMFTEKGSYGTAQADNRTTLTISYRIGPLEEVAHPATSKRLPPEILEELKESLLDAELVFEIDN